MYYGFGDYTLDTERYELYRTGVPRRSGAAGLRFLGLSRATSGLHRDERRPVRQLWPDEPAVSDNSLTNCVAQARRVLGDTGQAQQYIQTVYGRGYRFIALVTNALRGDEEASLYLILPSKPPSGPRPRARKDRNGPRGRSARPRGVPTDTEGGIASPFPPPGPGPPAAAAQLTVWSVICWASSGTPPPVIPKHCSTGTEDYQRCAPRSCTSLPGRLPRYQGIGLVVYFGYPQAHEDDARRAVHTGLGDGGGHGGAQQTPQAHRGVRLAVQVGIHTGIVVVGAMGQDKRAPLALGDTPTIAAQVQGLAAPDTVVISPATLRLVQGYFVCQALGTIFWRMPPAAGGLPGPPGASRPEPVRGRGHEGLHTAGGPGAGAGAAPRALDAGKRRAGAGSGAERGGGDWQITPGAGAQRAPGRGSAYPHRVPLFAILPAQCLLSCDRAFPAVPAVRKEDTPRRSCASLKRRWHLWFSPGGVVPLFAALLSLPLPERYPPLALTPERQKQKTLEALLTWLLREAERQPVCLSWKTSTG